MSATLRCPSALLRLVVAPAVVVLSAVALSAQPSDSGKKAAEPPKSPSSTSPAPKDTAKSPPVGIRLPDGTFLWTGPGETTASGERVLISPQELQKLLDQVDQLKKQLAARRPSPPSGCSIQGRIDKRGDALVAVIKVTYAFRTSTPNAAVALGGKRAFLVAATMDKARLPVLDTGEDGFASLVETPGDHSLTLDLEVPVTGRGTKTEIGFELGLPRAAITTLALTPPSGVKVVNLSTRAVDQAQPAKAPDTRRELRLDVKRLTPGPGSEGYPLGPVDLVEVAWEPPAAAPAAEMVQTAELEVASQINEGFIETAATIRPRGTSRVWKVVAPADAVLAVERSRTTAASADSGSLQPPTIARPTDPGKPIWKIDIPAGTVAGDWLITATVRTLRPKASDPKHKGPFPIGPFAVLDVARQTGTVRVSAVANTRLVFKHGPDLRQDIPPTPPGDETQAFFRFATGPSGSALPAPLLEIEARPLAGTIQVRPTYKLQKLAAGESEWRVRVELRVTPIRTEIDTLTIDLPADWRGRSVSPPDLVEGVQTTKGGGTRQSLAVHLASGQKHPFDLVLTARIPVAAAAKDAAVSLPRFPGATERDTTVTVSVPEGLEVHAVGREWDGDQPADWAQPLTPSAGSESKLPKAATALTGRFEHGLARVDLSWSPYRPELSADIRAEIAIQDGQMVVTEQVTLRSADGLPRPIRWHGPADLRGLKGVTPLDHAGPGEWTVIPPIETKDAAFSLVFALPLPAHPDDMSNGWKIPIALLWPLETTRTECVVRVWPGFGPGRTVQVESGPWRELPPEPLPGRDALPALTLAGSGAGLPLTLRVSEVADSAAAAVWIDRGLVQVWVRDDDAATCRARFLLTRWLTDTVEIAYPEPLTGPYPEILLDGRKAEPIPGGASANGRTIRVPLPEGRPGRSIVVEVRYQLPPGQAERGTVFTPPLPQAASTGPVRWQVTVPTGQIPLVTGGGRVEQRWALRTGLLAPAAVSPDELERWFQTGTEPDRGTGPPETAVAMLTGFESVRVYHLPRVGLVIICSVTLLFVGLIVSRLPAGAAGLVVAALGGTAAVGAVLFPQPAGQIVGAAEPGLAALVLFLSGQLAARWHYRRRVTYLPGFARTWTEPTPVSAHGPGRSQSSQNGSTGPHNMTASHNPEPVAPSGS